MEFFKFFSTSPEYEKVKNCLKEFSKELDKVRSRKLSGEEDRYFKNKYKRILALAEDDNISTKEFGKLQMAIKQIRRKHDHLGLFRQLSFLDTVSAWTMTESYPIFNDVSKGETNDNNNPEKNSDRYIYTVSLLKDMMTNIANSVSFTETDKLIYKLQFETIRDTLKEENFTKPELDELSDLYNKNLKRFKNYVRINEPISRCDIKPETQNLKTEVPLENKFLNRWKRPQKKFEEKILTQATSCSGIHDKKSKRKSVNQRTSFSNVSSGEEILKKSNLETKSNSLIILQGASYEEVIKITDFLQEQKQCDSNIDDSKQTQTEERVEWCILGNIRGRPYTFVSSDECYVPLETNQNIQNFSFKTFLNRNQKVRPFQDLPKREQYLCYNINRLDQGVKQSLIPKGVSIEQETKKGYVNASKSYMAITEAKEKYLKNLEKINYKRLLNECTSLSSEQSGQNSQDKSKPENKRDIKLVSQTSDRDKNFESSEFEETPRYYSYKRFADSNFRDKADIKPSVNLGDEDYQSSEFEEDVVEDDPRYHQDEECFFSNFENNTDGKPTVKLASERSDRGEDFESSEYEEEAIEKSSRYHPDERFDKSVSKKKTDIKPRVNLLSHVSDRGEDFESSEFEEADDRNHRRKCLGAVKENPRYHSDKRFDSSTNKVRVDFISPAKHFLLEEELEVQNPKEKIDSKPRVNLTDPNESSEFKEIGWKKNSRPEEKPAVKTDFKAMINFFQASGRLEDSESSEFEENYEERVPQRSLSSKIGDINPERNTYAKPRRNLTSQFYDPDKDFVSSEVEEEFKRSYGQKRSDNHSDIKPRTHVGNRDEDFASSQREEKRNYGQKRCNRKSNKFNSEDTKAKRNLSKNRDHFKPIQFEEDADSESSILSRKSKNFMDIQKNVDNRQSAVINTMESSGVPKFLRGNNRPDFYESNQEQRNRKSYDRSGPSKHFKKRENSLLKLFDDFLKEQNSEDIFQCRYEEESFPHAGYHPKKPMQPARDVNQAGNKLSKEFRDFYKAKGYDETVGKLLQNFDNFEYRTKYSFEQNHYARDLNSEYYPLNFDLDSVDSLRDEEKIDVLHNYTKAFATKVDNFNKGKFSLEYFVLGKILRRLKTKIENIRCQQNDVNDYKKSQLLKNLEKLKTALNKRGK